MAHLWCQCPEFTDPCRRCLNSFPFQKPGSRLCHFHLCVAEGISANAAKLAVTSQCDAAGLYTPLVSQGLAGVSMPREGVCPRPPKAPEPPFPGSSPGGLPGPQEGSGGDVVLTATSTVAPHPHSASCSLGITPSCLSVPSSEEAQPAFTELNQGPKSSGSAPRGFLYL